MSYLSTYQLATLEELINQESITQTKDLLINTSNMKNVDRQKKDIQNKEIIELNKENSKFSISYSNFLKLLESVEQPFMKPNEKNQQRSSNQLISKNEFHLIRQIILLTFRKLDEIGSVVRQIRKYNFEDMYNALNHYNPKKNKAPNFFDTFGVMDNSFKLIKSKDRNEFENN
jgi:hypothetical protein